ncbi:hypothetical protein ZOD2009_12687 [Haladaptatus paucihalophilus DX253]|uniref:DUF7344 domain-containing protein n=1 Tax=Haladaptatus paucihalophilus DX253 TaxID=797209 RepID=E7QUQ3_HALPU|nr:MULTISPECIES: hypothetical protein [Haladaptatus]EFW91710.1 hypothetical protein ZOD2009_12687 [Haladaptatus paucihalophilus DX253]GKZ12323.1 hypothetical protein HAL_02040 [Haladaptatus sp. T7]SHJ96429.1 hypothetical protein SAMN05444342_0092 [Haladaptatus paucihalophilus DX253]
MDHGLPLSRSFDVLSHYRRRLVLYHLLETFDGAVHHDALAEIIVNETDGMEVTAETHDRAMTSLRHVHFPKLADAGLIESGREENTVRLRTLPTMVERLLDLSSDYEMGTPSRR